MGISATWKVLAISGAALTLTLTGCSTTTGTPGKMREEARQRQASNKAELGAQQARQDFEVGNLKNALYNIEGSIKLDASNADYYITRGRILIEMNQLDPALESFSQALKLDPTRGDAHYYSGLVYQRWSQLPQAAEEYTAALHVDQANADYMLAALETLISMRQLDEADALIESCRPYFENNAAVKRSQGHLAMLRNQPVAAADHFQRALLLNPDDKSILEVLVVAYMQAENFAKAEYYLDQLFRDPAYAARPDLRHLKALCLTSEDRLVEARSMYLKLIDDDPSDPQIWFELGSVAFKLGDMRRVQNVVSRTIAVWPNRFESFVLRGMVSEYDNRLNDAIADYNRACDLHPNHEEPYMLLGLALQRTGRDPQAAEAFQHARMIAPRSERAKNLAAQASVKTDVETSDTLNR